MYSFQVIHMDRQTCLQYLASPLQGGGGGGGGGGKCNVASLYHFLLTKVLEIYCSQILRYLISIKYILSNFRLTLVSLEGLF